jgi:hypothetical protein
VGVTQRCTTRELAVSVDLTFLRATGKCPCFFIGPSFRVLRSPGIDGHKRSGAKRWQLSRYRCDTAVARARTFLRIMGRTPAMRISTIANVQTMVAPVGKSINRDR